MGGPEAVRVLILPNLATYSNNLLRDGLADDNPRRPEAERVLGALLALLGTLKEGRLPQVNGHVPQVTEEVRERLTGKVGEIIAERIAEGGEVQLAQAILEA